MGHFYTNPLEFNDDLRIFYGQEPVITETFIDALIALQKQNINPILIGGLAIGFHGVVRGTEDIDFLFLARENLPARLESFKKKTDHKFEHERTQVELDVIDSKHKNYPQQYVDYVFNTAILKHVADFRGFWYSFYVASAEGIMLLKLSSARLIDQADIIRLIRLGIKLPILNLVEKDFELYKFLIEKEREERES